MKLSKRGIALLLSILMMSFCLIPGLAESAITEKSILEKGGTLEVNVDLKVNTENLLPLLSALMGPSTEQTSVLINTMIETVNKLQTKAVYNLTDSSLEIGTDKGKLIEGQFKLDEGKNQVLAGLNILPDYLIAINTGNISAKDQLARQAEATQVITKALEGFYNDNIKGQKAEDGQFEVAEYGKFATKTKLDVTAKLFADFLNVLIKQVKENEYLALTLAVPAAAGNENPIAAFEGLVEELNKNPDKVLMKLEVYGKGANDSLYISADIADGYAFLGIFTVPGKELSTLNAKFLGKSTKEGEGEKTDWLALEKAIKAKENIQDFLITFNMESDSAKGSSKFDMDFTVSGQDLGLTGWKTSEKDTLNKSGEASFLFSGKPLFSLVFSLKESANKPAAFSTDGKNAILLDDKVSEEDANKLTMNLIEKGLPLFTERLNTVLPEESGVLTMILQMLSTNLPASSN